MNHSTYFSFAKRVCCHLLFGSLILFSVGASAKVVTDMAGRQVDVPANVNRILLGEGRLFHAIALLEGQKPFDRIVGWQGDFRKLDPQNYAIYRAQFPEVDNIPLIGNTTADSISAEKVLTLNPDLAIFGLSGHGPGKESELVNQLEKAGVAVIFVDFRNEPLVNTLPSMRLLGEALQREAQAERFIEFYQQSIQRVTNITNQISAAQKPNVFIELKAGTSNDCCTTAGDGNLGNFIDLAGGNNVAKTLLPGALGTVNLEKIIASDPDVYIATGGQLPNATTPGLKLGAEVQPEQTLQSAKSLLTRTGISSLSAIKNGRTYAIWHGYYNSPYNLLVVQNFAKWFYPDKFDDLDPSETMQQLYSEFLAIKPTGTFWLDNLNSKTN